MHQMQAPYWRPDLCEGVPYTFEKMAQEYSERRISPEDIFQKGGPFGERMTFRQVLRSERELQRLIGEKNLPETLDPRRGPFAELWHRICLLDEIVRKGDISRVEFIRRLERLEAEIARQKELVFGCERNLADEQALTKRYRMALSVACHALRDTAACVSVDEFSDEQYRRELHRTVLDVLNKILTYLSEENSSLLLTEETASKLSIVYRAEIDSNVRIAQKIKRANEILELIPVCYAEKKALLSKYHDAQRRYFKDLKAHALHELMVLQVNCQRISAKIGNLRAQVARRVIAKVKSGWHVKVRRRGKRIPWRWLCSFIRHVDEHIAIRDVYAVYIGGLLSGIVVSGTAVYVRDHRHSIGLSIGVGHKFEVHRVNFYTRKLRVDGKHEFVFHDLFWSEFDCFVKSIDEICNAIQLPDEIVKVVERVREYELDGVPEEMLQTDPVEIVVHESD